MARVVNVSHEPCDVYVGRAHAGRPESPWGNPYRIEADPSARLYRIHVRGSDGRWREYTATHSKQLAVYSLMRFYRIHVERELGNRLPELIGKRLGCWCAPGPCHANVLVQLLVDRGLDVRDPDPQLGLELGERRAP